MPTEANVHGNKGVPQIPVQGTKTIFASVGIDPKQSVIALWMRKLCGAIYVVCNLCVTVGNGAATTGGDEAATGRRRAAPRRTGNPGPEMVNRSENP